MKRQSFLTSKSQINKNISSEVTTHTHTHPIYKTEGKINQKKNAKFELKL